MQQALLDTMESQVSRQCDENLAKARKDAESVIAEARSRAEQRSTRALEHERAVVERLNRRARELAEVTAEHEELTMEQAIADEILAQAENELAALAESPDFPGILEGLLAELMDGVSGDGVILSPPNHLETCRAWLAKHGKGSLTVKSAPDLVDGVAFQDPAKSYRVTNAMLTRLSILQNEARKTCLDTLFPKGTQA